MKSERVYNTGMTFNTTWMCYSPTGPNQLIPSKNTAFCIHRKRTRDEFPSEELVKCKRPMYSEYPDDYTISSASSITSLPPKALKFPESSVEAQPEQEEGQKESEGKLYTKVVEFRPYNELTMETRPEYYAQNLKDVGNQSSRGRKRANVVKKATSLQHLISDIVVPEWEEYLIDKRDKENSYKNVGIRSDAVWKKIMRDCREFYRILFKNRFHRMDYQDYDQKINCIQTLIQELGLPQFKDENLIYSFNFFHQIHLSEKNKAKYESILSDLSTGFDALTRYTNQSRTMFLEDPLCSRLLYFLYRNFLDFYFQLLSKTIKQKVQECVQHILREYEGLSKGDDVISTTSLPI